jgi:hypothetical protein
MKYKNNLKGKKFGRLTVLNFVKKDEHYECLWDCLCSCGIRKTIRSSNLVRKNGTVSCGCFRREQNSKRLVKMLETHGLSKGKFYKTWLAIKSRLKHSSKYSKVTINPKWKLFSGFYKDMYIEYVKHVKNNGERQTTIDRINNNKGYSKENCRWATYKEQARNKKNTLNITYNGKTQCLTDWSKDIGLCVPTLKHRINLGWTIHEVFTTPSRNH